MRKLYPPRDYLIIFDCDGTLIDSANKIVRAMRQAWASNGLKPPPENAIRRGVGLKLNEAICQLMASDCTVAVETLVDSYVEAFRDSCNVSEYVEPLYPGIRSCLGALNDKGFLLGIATGKSRRGLQRTLNQHALLDFFQILKTADDGPSKPSPDILLDAMAEIGVKPQNTAMIGDTVYDVKMAVNAAVKPIGVNWGYHDASELKRAGAETILEDCNNLLTVLKNIWNEVEI